MRLIDTTTLELKEFLGEPTDRFFPRYAILSHTWGEEEVTFQDMQNLEVATTKAGFDKIAKCCKTARNEGLGWAWVDTCCIDKTSSAELSEAINSMFKWYGNSAICYAYLSDVRFSLDTEGPLSGMKRFLSVMERYLSDVKRSLSDLEREISDIKEPLPDSESLPYTDWGDSRWFSRGWTLQELIAPFEVILYDRDWKQLGTKRRLVDQLQKRTRIPESVLLNRELTRKNSVLARMSWAMDRNTTRIEDRAYSLLGIFDINMPLLYGEGKKTFTRLHREILETIDDDTIFLGGVNPKSIETDGLLATPGDFLDVNSTNKSPLTLVAHGLDSVQPYSPANIPGHWGGNNMRDPRLRGDVLSMSMPIIEVAIPNRPSPRTGVTMNKQFQDDMDSMKQQTLESFIDRNEGMSLCLGMLRCGKDGQFVARYFMCSLVHDGISAYPLPCHCFVSPEVAFHWPYMPCYIQLNSVARKQTGWLRALRTPSRRSPEFPLHFGNGWTLNSVPMPTMKGMNFILCFERRDEIWSLALTQNIDSSFLSRIILKCDTYPKIEAQIVNIGGRERDGPVAELCRRMPVLGGSADLVISIYLETKIYRTFTPMIRFRAFEPSEDEKVE